MDASKQPSLTLGAALDCLNEEIVAVEKAIKQSGTPLEVEVALPPAAGSDPIRGDLELPQFLVFGHRNGAWGLFVETYDDEPEPVGIKELTSVQYKTRLAAVERLPELWKEFRARSSAEVGEILKARDKLRALSLTIRASSELHGAPSNGAAVS